MKPTIAKVFIVLLVFGVIVSGILTVINIDKVFYVPIKHADAQYLFNRLYRENDATKQSESYWNKLEQSDDSAIRAQVYNQHAIHERLKNIDSTLEISVKICHEDAKSIVDTLSVLAYILLYILVAIVVLMALSAIFILYIVLR